jgi:hypothetical protein
VARLPHRHPCGRDRQHAGIRHRFAGVPREVQQRHLELVGVGQCRRQVRGQVHAHFHPLARGAGDELRHVSYEVPYIHGAGLKRLAPREREQALHQHLGPLGRLQRPVHEPPLAPAADPAA